MKTNSQLKVVIVGKTDLAQAIFSRLLATKFNPSEIILIGTSDMHLITTPKSIILAGDCYETKETLMQLKKVSFLKEDYEIISFLPYLNAHKIKLHLDGGNSFTVRHAACNLNIESGTGIICSDGDSSLLRLLGTVIIEKKERILASSVLIGDIISFDYRVILMDYDACVSSLTLRPWLLGLREILRSFDFNERVPVNPKYSLLHQYVIQKRDFFVKYSQFQYGNRLRRRATITLQSCVDYLLSLPDPLTVASIHDRLNYLTGSDGYLRTSVRGFISEDGQFFGDRLEEALLQIFEQKKEFKLKKVA